MSPQKKISLFLFLTLALSMFSYVPIIRASALNVNGGMYVLTILSVRNDVSTPINDEAVGKDTLTK